MTIDYKALAAAERAGQDVSKPSSYSTAPATQTQSKTIDYKAMAAAERAGKGTAPSYFSPRDDNSAALQSSTGKMYWTGEGWISEKNQNISAQLTYETYLNRLLSSQGSSRRGRYTAGVNSSTNLPDYAKNERTRNNRSIASLQEQLQKAQAEYGRVRIAGTGGKAETDLTKQIREL